LLICFSVSCLHNISFSVSLPIVRTLLIDGVDGANKRCGRPIRSCCIAVRRERRGPHTWHGKTVCDAWENRLRGPLWPQGRRLQQLRPLPGSHQ
jgi:hypothetical protein